MISAVELKRRKTGATILGVIVSKLSHRQESGPIILLEVDEGSKIGFHHTILLFGLPVCLGVESNVEFSLDA